MLKLFAGLALACLVTPAFAQECTKMDDVIAMLKSHGNTIAADIALPGDVSDRLVIVVTAEKIILLGGKAGCFVAGPIPLDDVADPNKPKLQGSGLEIGA